MHKIFLHKNLKGRDLLEDKDMHGTIILKCILKKQSFRMWIEFICFRIGTSGRLFLNKLLNILLP
jgi:hypothetical protein